MTKTDGIASFVLRFTQKMWQDAQGEPHVQWRGHIRHVQGDEECRFTDFAEAVAFIQRYLTQLTLNSLTGQENMSQDQVLHESFKLWEQFASSYTDMMFQAMEQTIKQSEVFREQLDQVREQTIQTWQLPRHPTQSDIVEALDNLQAQMQILTEKIQILEKAMGEKPDGAESRDVT